MCLTRLISKTEEGNAMKGVQQGFKVMARYGDEGRFTTPCARTWTPRVVGEWIHDSCQGTLLTEDEPYEEYSYGFHMLTTLEDAKLFVDWLCDGSFRREWLHIHEAEYDNVVATGVQELDRKNLLKEYTPVEVEVARSIKIGEEVCA